MATFETKQILIGSPTLIPEIAKAIQMEFQNEGYDVAVDALSCGGYDISIAKGGIFKAVLGMKTALKVTIIPQANNIYFEAGIGIWGQQAIPAVISMFFLWPVLITQIWGMVQQAKLDDKALSIANRIIMKDPYKEASNLKDPNASGMVTKFCTQCGLKNYFTARFCSNCGREL